MVGLIRPVNQVKHSEIDLQGKCNDTATLGGAIYGMIWAEVTLDVHSRKKALFANSFKLKFHHK
jgi:hypothetical protein